MHKRFKYHGRHWTQDESLSMFPKEFTENRHPTERTDSDEDEDRNRDTDLTKPMCVLKRRGVVARRGRLNCGHHVFVESYEDGCSVFDDSSIYDHGKTAEGIPWLLGQAEGFGPNAYWCIPHCHGTIKEDKRKR